MSSDKVLITKSILDNLANNINEKIIKQSDPITLDEMINAVGNMSVLSPKEYVNTDLCIDIDFTDSSLINNTTGIITDKLGTQFNASFDNNYKLSGNLTIPANILQNIGTSFTIELNIDMFSRMYNANSSIIRTKTTYGSFLWTRQVCYYWTNSNSDTSESVYIGDWNGSLLDPARSLLYPAGTAQILLTFDTNGTVKLYRNKTLVNTYTCTDFVSFSALLSSPWFLMKVDNWEYLAFRVYNHVLSDLEINKNYEYMKRNENTPEAIYKGFLQKSKPEGDFVINNIDNPSLSLEEFPITSFYSESLITAPALNLSKCRLLKEFNCPNLEDFYNANFVFRYCRNLEKINLPSLKKIYGANIFEETYALKTLVLPSLGKYNNIGSLCMQSIFAGNCFFKSNIEKLDIFTAWRIDNNAFKQASNFNTFVIRSLSPPYPNELHPALNGTDVFLNTPFGQNGSGGTIYIPKFLYDQLGTGSALDFKSATNWSVVDSYGNITWKQIEGSQYEHYYVDGTPIISS